MHWLLGETSKLNTLIPKRSLRANLRRDIGNRSGHRLDALRRSQRRELLRIGAAEGRGARFCIAAGKFGGRELTFGSDLDLFFAYEGRGLRGVGRGTSRSSPMSRRR